MTDLLATHSIQFTPCYPVTLRFHNKQRRMVYQCNSHDLMVFGDYTNPYFRTELEYRIAMNRQIGRGQYSYIDVFDQDEFICRHYVRHGILSPLVGFEPDIMLDPLARLPQIAAKPMLDWRRIINDTMFGKANRDINREEFINKYKH